MSTISVQHLDQKSIITLPERFDFTNQTDFRRSYEKYCTDPARRFVVDFEQVKSLDSAALGMLLLMHDDVGSRFDSPVEERVQFINCTDEIKNILKIANFQELFNIT